MRLALACLLLTTACGREPGGDASLVFLHDGGAPERVPMSELRETAPPVTVDAFDPYYERRARYTALPLGPLLTRAFDMSARQLRGATIRVRARDGYELIIEAATVLDDGAYLAIDDLDHPGFAPIGPRQVSPGPFYLVWGPSEAARGLETHPRPWQVESFELVDPERDLGHVAPTGASDEAYRGFALFRRHCARCHAINRKGGRVGPDLNLPRNILEYRPEAQVRAFIRDPETFRYSQMPAHSLSDSELDALIAYLRAMGERKHDEAS